MALSTEGGWLGRRWRQFLFTGFSAESLGLLRICFGAGLLPFHIIQFESLLSLAPRGATFYYIEPIWYFDLLGIDHSVPLLTMVMFAVLMVATITMTVGLGTRTSIVLVIIAIFYLKGVRDSFSADVHHRYLMPINGLFLLLFSRCGWAYSLDRRIRPSPRPLEWEASWPIKAMQLYVASFYFWSVVAKLRVSGWNWFAGGQRVQNVLLRRSLLWGVDDAGNPVGNVLAYELARNPTICFWLGMTTLALEAGFPLILLIDRPRWRLLFLCGVGIFHLVNFVLLYVGFVLIPIVFLAFFDLEPIYQRLRRRWRSPSPPRPAAASP